MQTVQTLGADCADFGCRLCSSGPGMNLFGCRLCRLWVQTVQQRARNVFFGCRLCRQGQRQCSGPGMFFLGADCADRDKDSADRDKDSADRDKDSADRDKDSADCRLQSEHNK